MNACVRAFVCWVGDVFKHALCVCIYTCIFILQQQNILPLYITWGIQSTPRGILKVNSCENTYTNSLTTVNSGRICNYCYSVSLISLSGPGPSVVVCVCQWSLPSGNACLCLSLPVLTWARYITLVTLRSLPFCMRRRWHITNQHVCSILSSSNVYY